MRRIAAVLATLPGESPAVLHLGAGALTLPRYMHALHPASRQRVVELYPELLAFVTTHVPLPPDAPIELAIGDARAEVQRLAGDGDDQWDLVLVDVFSGGAVPRHVTTIEFFTELVSLLSPGGALIVNCLNGAEPQVTGDTLAAGAELLPDVLVIGSRRCSAPGCSRQHDHRGVAASARPRIGRAVALDRPALDGRPGATVVDGPALEELAGTVRHDPPLGTRDAPDTRRLGARDAPDARIRTGQRAGRLDRSSRSTARA